MTLKNSLSILSLSALMVGLPVGLHAQSGDYAMEVLTIGVGARPLAMGGAFTAAASDATAAYWNPAGLALVDDMQITTMHRTSWDLYAYDFINLAFSTPSAGSYALSYMRLGDDFFATNDGITGVMSGYSENAGFLSGGWKIGKKMAIGGTIKLLKTDAFSESAFGVGADLGFLWRPVKELTVGIVARDFTGGSHIFWTTGTTEVLQPNATLGLSYTQELGKRERGVPVSTLSFNFDFDSLYVEKGLNNYHLGAEYWYKQFVAVRGGLLSRGLQFDSDSFIPSAGVGVWAYIFEIDYAFVNTPLGGTHNLSIITRL